MIEPELEAKRLEILKEILPAARRFGVLNDRTVVSPARSQARDDGARAVVAPGRPWCADHNAIAWGRRRAGRAF
jgi:hypothetical protein